MNINYEMSALVRYTLAGIVMVFGLWLASRKMEEEREKLLKEHQTKREERKKNKKSDHRSLLTRPVDEFFIELGEKLQEKGNFIQWRILLLPYWGRVAVLMLFMAVYCGILIYFKMDRTSMEKE